MTKNELIVEVRTHLLNQLRLGNVEAGRVLVELLGQYPDGGPAPKPTPPPPPPLDDGEPA